MPDRLASLFRHFRLSARVFHTGALCNQVSFDAGRGEGYVHVLKSGQLDVRSTDGPSLTLEAPSLLLYLKPTSHRLHPRSPGGVELVCGTIDMGAGCDNPLTLAAPSPQVISLAGQHRLQLTLDLLFAEAFGQACGRQDAMNRLCELLVIQVVRHLMEGNEVNVGLLAGLADPRLAKALSALHDDPAHNWTLDSLARTAGMSRARFAVRFRDTVGITPGEYQTQWRMALAQSLLRGGKPVNLVAHAVGYSGPAAFGRVFRQRYGLSPSSWARLNDMA